MKPLDNLSGFATFFQEDGQYYFQLNDEQGHPVLFSHGYQSEKSRDNGIKTVIRNAPLSERYEQKQSAQGHYFILKSGNHQEIARSCLFDTPTKMEAAQQLVSKLQKDVAVFERKEKKQSVKPVAVSPQSTETSLKKSIKQGAPGKETSSLPRYKFSVIYYPGSDKWTVKADFPDSSPKVNPADEQQIGALLQPYLPLEAPTSTRRSSKVPTGVSQEATRGSERLPTKPDPSIQEELELKFLTYYGKEIKVASIPQHLVQLEVLSKAKEPYAENVLYDIQLEAKSLQNNEQFVVETVKSKPLRSGRILIPIKNTQVLKSGIYRFTATVHPHEVEEERPHSSGSCLLILN